MKECPYAIRQWSHIHQYKPGCKSAKTDHCGADPECALIRQEKKGGGIFDKARALKGVRRDER